MTAMRLWIGAEAAAEAVAAAAAAAAAPLPVGISVSIFVIAVSSVESGIRLLRRPLIDRGKASYRSPYVSPCGPSSVCMGMDSSRTLGCTAFLKAEKLPPFVPPPIRGSSVALGVLGPAAAVGTVPLVILFIGPCGSAGIPRAPVGTPGSTLDIGPGSSALGASLGLLGYSTGDVLTGDPGNGPDNDPGNTGVFPPVIIFRFSILRVDMYRYLVFVNGKDTEPRA